MHKEYNEKFDPLELIDEYERGGLTRGELSNALAKFCWKYPTEKDKMLDQVSQHPDEAVRGVGDEIREMIRRTENQIKDIDHIRRTSPLQPGVALFLYGGYDSAYSASWWLDSREYYKATFIDFVHRGADVMPAAFVELENDIDMTEGSGLRHKGRYALLKLRSVADWAETETVTVHVVEKLPTDVEAYYSSHPFGTEIESHATYKIVNKEETIRNNQLADGA